MRPVPRTLFLVCLSLCAPAMAQNDAAPPPAPVSVEAPGPTIASVDVAGNTVVPTEDIRAAITLRPGTPFSTEQYQRDADAIEKLYTDRGYQAVASPAGVSQDASGAVRYQITEAVVESIEVRGNRKTRRGTILKVAEIEPGRLYTRQQAQADVRSLFNLGIFQDVTYRLEPGTQVGRVQVVYSVEETKTGQVAAGLSYSGDSGVIGQLQVLETNLGGRANALGAYIQSGGKYYRSGFQLTFHNPFIDGRRTALDVGAYAKTVYRFTDNDFFGTGFSSGRDYDEYRTGGDVALSRRVGNGLTGAVGFRGNRVKAHYAYDIFAGNNGTPSLGAGAAPPPGAYLGEGRRPDIPDGNVYVGTLSLARDRRDYALDPGAGGAQVVSLEVGSVRTDTQNFITGADTEGNPIIVRAPGDSGAITRLSFDVRQYASRGRSESNPTRPVPVVAARLVGGTVSGTVPFWEQFFVGGIGIGGVRYARFISAANAYEDPFITSSQALRGYVEGRFWGRSMLVGSLEYRYPLGPNTRAIAFVDAGDAWDADVRFLNPNQQNPKTSDDSFNLHSSVGVGLRVATPIGPIRVDFGIGSEGSRTHFSIGQVF